MNKKTQRLIGLFGGTFDPIHYGHLSTLWEIYQRTPLDECRIIPSAIPPHRNTPLSSANHRYEMAKLAIKDLPADHFMIDDCEIDREGASYTVDTLDYFSQKLHDCTFCLIIGMDAFLGLHTWHRWQEIIDKVNLIVAHRPEYELSELTEPLAPLLAYKINHPEELKTTPNRKILFLPVTQLAISATRIRQQLALGQLPRFLVPEAVLEYMKQHHLYGYQESLCNKPN